MATFRTLSESVKFVAVVFAVALAVVACSKSDTPVETAADLDAHATHAQPAANPTANAADKNAMDRELADKLLVPIYFGFDSYALDETAIAELTDLARFLRERPAVALKVEGHCDDRGSVEYNLALGDQRARATRKALTRLGIDGERLDTISYGELKPAVKGGNEGSWSKNRRAAFAAR